MPLQEKALDKQKEEKAIMKKIEALEKRHARLEKQLRETDSEIYSLQLHSFTHSEQMAQKHDCLIPFTSKVFVDPILSRFIVKTAFRRIYKSNKHPIHLHKKKLIDYVRKRFRHYK